MDLPFRRSGRLATLPIAAFVLLLCISSGAMSQEDEIDDEYCLACHDEMDLTLTRTSHRLGFQIESPATVVTCLGCHPGGEIHADEPEIDNISNPSRLSGHDAKVICSQCHMPHQELDNYGFDSHSLQQLNCTSCHRVHGGEQSLLLDDAATFCQRCHQSVETEFLRRSAHPVRQKVLTCLSCHQFTRRADNNLAYDLNRTCRGCHPEQGGPFLYEHESVNGFSLEGSGCVECHAPHGSQNDNLLRQPENQLCRSCHVEHVTANHGNLWSTVWSDYSCSTCHADLHGSFDNANYLDVSLADKFGGDCLDSKCHGSSGQGGF